MSESLGLVSYEQPRQSMFLPEGFSSSKNYSEAKAAEIDSEIDRLVEKAHQRVQKILSERRDVLNELAKLLSEKESVNGEELREMLRPGGPGGKSSSSRNSVYLRTSAEEMDNTINKTNANAKYIVSNQLKLRQVPLV